MSTPTASSVSSARLLLSQYLGSVGLWGSKLKYMYPSSKLHLNFENDTHVYFFTGPYYPLDNFWAHQVEIWWRKFATVEHAYQWRKFSLCAPEIAEQIFNATSPEKVKDISILNAIKTPQDWRENRIQVMYEILLAKTLQHEDVHKMLIETWNKIIAESSPVDSFWWIGADGKWENTVGKIWMRIREEICSSLKK